MDENNISECGTTEDEFNKMIDGSVGIRDIQEYKVMRFAMCIGNAAREECMDFSAADYYRCNAVGRMIRTNFIDFVDFIKQDKSEQTVNAAADIYKNDCMHEVGLMSERTEAELFCDNIKNVTDVIWGKESEVKKQKAEYIKCFGIVMGCAAGIICLIAAWCMVSYLLKARVEKIKECMKRGKRSKETSKKTLNFQEHYEMMKRMAEIEDRRNGLSRRVCDIQIYDNGDENKNKTVINHTDIEESIDLEKSKKTVKYQHKETKELDIEI